MSDRAGSGLAAGDRLDGPARAAIAAVVVSAFLVFLDATVVNVALDRLTADLGTDLATSQWVVTAYLLASTAALPAAGWLANRVGVTRIFVVGLAGFAVSSLLCAVAWGPWELVGFRAVQGVAGGLVAAVGHALLVHASPPSRLHRTIGLVSVPVVLAPVLGPLIGGVLAAGPGWRWIFLGNVPLCALAAATAWWRGPRVGANRRGSLDVVGLVLVAGAMAAVTFGLTRSWQPGAAGSGTAALVAGTALFVLFVAWSRRARGPERPPLLALRLLRGPVFGPAAAAAFLLRAAIYGGMIVMPLYFQAVRHLDASAAGLLTAPTGLGALVASALVARCVRTVGAGVTAVTGAALAALATVPLVLVDAATPYGLLATAMAVRGAGIALAMVPVLAAAYAAVPSGDVNDATTQLNVLQRLGDTVGTVLVVVVMTAGSGAVADVPGPYAAALGWMLATGALVVPVVLHLARTVRAGGPG